MEERIVSDKNLLKYIKESDIQKIAELFSLGKFSEIIENFFIKKKKEKTEPIKLFDEFNISENSKNEINLNENYISKSNKDIININQKSFSDININDFNNIISNSSNDLSLFSNNDFILNKPKNYNNNVNDLDKEKKENNNPYLENVGIIEDYYNSVNNEKEFDYDLIDKFENDKLSQQILLTIVIYCLMKIKNDVDLRTIFSKYNISIDNSIFPLILLKAKFYFKINLISQCLDIYSQAIIKYNDFKSKFINDNNNIIYIETFKQDFIYFNNLFNYLFALNNIDSKIKKLYYEQKFCLYKLGFHSEGFKLLIELYNKYPQDVQIQFELGKDSIYFSKYDIYKEMLEILQKSVKEETNMNKRSKYLNYYIYLQGLSFLAQDKIENARSCFTEILKNDTTNIVVINNNALLSIYENQSKETNDILNLIEDPHQMDSYNECIHENINILKQKYKADIQKYKK